MNTVLKHHIVKLKVSVEHVGIQYTAHLKQSLKCCELKNIHVKVTK